MHLIIINRDGLKYSMSQKDIGTDYITIESKAFEELFKKYLKVLKRKDMPIPGKIHFPKGTITIENKDKG